MGLEAELYEDAALTDLSVAVTVDIAGGRRGGEGLRGGRPSSQDRQHRGYPVGYGQLHQDLIALLVMCLERQTSETQDDPEPCGFRSPARAALDGVPLPPQSKQDRTALRAP